MGSPMIMVSISCIKQSTQSSLHHSLYQSLSLCQTHIHSLWVSSTLTHSQPIACVEGLLALSQTTDTAYHSYASTRSSVAVICCLWIHNALHHVIITAFEKCQSHQNIYRSLCCLSFIPKPVSIVFCLQELISCSFDRIHEDGQQGYLDSRVPVMPGFEVTQSSLFFSPCPN